MSNKSNFTIDVFDYVDEHSFKPKVYLNVSHLTDDILEGLKNHPTYKDYLVEVIGVKRKEI